MYDYEKIILKPAGDVDVKVDVNLIPEYQRRQLAEFALEVTREVFARSGEEERYKAWLKKRQEGAHK